MLELLFNSVSVASLICEWENSACSRKRETCMLSFRSCLFAQPIYFAIFVLIVNEPFSKTGGFLCLEKSKQPLITVQGSRPEF
ncbi:hypothetical protein EQW70_09945 [Bacillus subtilis]|nr:hypothetical protein EQW70_09945 [Bacillus subtilis]